MCVFVCAKKLPSVVFANIVLCQKAVTSITFNIAVFFIVETVPVQCAHLFIAIGAILFKLFTKKIIVKLLNIHITLLYTFTC